MGACVLKRPEYQAKGTELLNIFSSFADWLAGIGSFFQSLYESNPDAFMIAVVAIILILIIIIIALAKAKSRAEGKKAIKYEDIDFSTDADRKDASVAAPVNTQPVSRGLPEPVTEEELRPKYGAFDVPNWMTKQTMSIDEANMIDADQWVDQQLSATAQQGASEADGQGNISGAEFTAAAATGVIMSREPGEPLKEVTVVVPDKAEPEQPAPVAAEPEPEERIHINESGLRERGEEPTEQTPTEPEPQPEPEPQVIHLNESNISERAAGPEPSEPEVTEEPPKPSFDTGTLAKIMKEQEEMAEEEPGAGIRAALDEAREEEHYGTDMSDAIRDEKPGLITMRTLGADPSAAEVSREYSELLEGNIDFAGNGIPGLRDQESNNERSGSSGAFAPQSVRRIHYGSHNRDTNRSGVKFTEEELMQKIRD